MAEIKGRRVYPDESGYPRLEPGDYGKDKDGQWWCLPPVQTKAWLGGLLTKHTVTEHDDGTITVIPSILITTRYRDETITWHGFLTKGVWREC